MPHISKRRTHEKILIMMRKNANKLSFKQTIKNILKYIYSIEKFDNQKRVKLFNLTLYKKYYKNNFCIRKYFNFLLKTETEHAKRRKYVSFLGIPILFKFRYTINNKLLKKNALFSKRSSAQSYYRDILKQIPNCNMYDHIYMCKHNLGEWFVFLNLLPEYIKKNNSKKPLILVPNSRYLYIAKMLCNKIDAINVNLQLSDIDLYTKEEEFGVDKYKFFIPYIDRFHNYRKEVQTGINNQVFSEYMTSSVGVIANNVIYSKPIFEESTKKSLHKKIKAIGLNLDNFIYISTEANSIKSISLSFWQNIVNRLNKLGFEIYCNDKLKLKGNVKYADLTIDETCLLATFSKGVIGLRSGLLDLISMCDVPFFVFYTFFSHINELDAE